MLLTFTSHKIACTADIEKAFLQIELNTQDNDVDKSANNPDNLIVCQFCQVLFGAAPSPYLLNATIQHHLIKQDDWVSNDLQRSIHGQCPYGNGWTLYLKPYSITHHQETAS